MARKLFICSMLDLSGDMLDLVPGPGIKPRPSALGARSLTPLAHQGSPRGGILNVGSTEGA